MFKALLSNHCSFKMINSYNVVLRIKIVYFGKALLHVCTQNVRLCVSIKLQDTYRNVSGTCTCRLGNGHTLVHTFRICGTKVVWFIASSSPVCDSRLVGTCTVHVYHLCMCRARLVSHWV